MAPAGFIHRFIHSTDMDSLVLAFKALGDENRLRIMALFTRTHQALCVCELVDALGLPQYQVSRHIRLLKQAGLLKVKKKGTWAYYYLYEESGFRKQLYDFLEKSLNHTVLEQDEQAMGVRLSYRKKGRCVLGSVPHSEIRKQIVT